MAAPCQRGRERRDRHADRVARGPTPGAATAGEPAGGGLATAAHRPGRFLPDAAAAARRRPPAAAATTARQGALRLVGGLFAGRPFTSDAAAGTTPCAAAAAAAAARRQARVG